MLELSNRVSLASFVCAAVAIGVLAFLPAPWSEVHAQVRLSEPPAAATGLGFGQRIAGTWVEPGDGYSTIISIRADGTMSWWGSWFFGNGTGAYFDGAVHGSWKQTGPREITTVEVGHLNDGDGTFVATGRVQEVFTFDEALESFDYEGTEDLFAPDQDPTDSDEVPFDSFEFYGGPIKRLNHMN